MKYHIEFDLEFNKNQTEGVYIAFEGIEASGKDTQAELLTKCLKEKGREVVLTKEPTREGVIGGLVHKILIGEVSVSPKALQYLFAADRAVHQEELLIPSLKKGKTVISSRVFWSSIVYGILDKGLEYNEKEVSQMMVAQSILSLYHKFLIPDYTFYLNIPVDVSLKRLQERHKVRQREIYEEKNKIEAMKTGYDWLFENFGENVVIIDGNKSVSEVSQQILKHLKI